MSSYIRFPYLNPIRFFKPGESDWTVNQIPKFYQRAGFGLRYQHGDTVYFQLQSKAPNEIFAASSLDLLNQEGQLQYSGSIPYSNTLDPVVSAAQYPEYNNYYGEFLIPVDLPEGIYYIRLNLMNETSQIITFFSEPLWVKHLWENTKIISYNNGVNNAFDVIFTGIPAPKFQFRLECGMKYDALTPSGTYVIFEDQNNKPFLLESIPFCTYKWTFGPPTGIPDWMANLINRAIALQNFYIGGRKLCRAEGAKLEPIRDTNWPLAAYQIEMLDAENSASEEFTPSQTGQKTLTWDNPDVKFDNPLITFDQNQI